MYIVNGIAYAGTAAEETRTALSATALNLFNNFFNFIHITPFLIL